MSWGLNSVNTSGRLQIDENFPNMLVIATGTCTNGDIINFPSAVNGNNIQVWARVNSAYRGSGQFIMHGYIYRGQSNTSQTQKKFRIWCSGVSDGQGLSGGGGILWDYFYNNPNSLRTIQANPMSYAGTASTTIDYVVCTEPSSLTAPTSGWGLNVHKSNGNLAYSSEYQVMDIVEDIKINLTPAVLNNNLSLSTKTNQPADRYVLINPTWHFRTQVIGFVGIAQYSGPHYRLDYGNNTIEVIYGVNYGGPAMGRSFSWINFYATNQDRHMQLGDLSA